MKEISRSSGKALFQRYTSDKDDLLIVRTGLESSGKRLSYRMRDATRLIMFEHLSKGQYEDLV